MDSIAQGAIYLIHNTITDAVYVGQTLGHYQERWNGHTRSLHRGTHENRHLQRAWQKYGRHAFEFVVIEHHDTIAALNEAERFYEQYFRAIGVALYNIRECGRNGRLREETRARMRGRIPSDVARANMRAAQLGRKLSSETLAKLRGREVSQETREKLRIAGRRKHDAARIEKNRQSHFQIGHGRKIDAATREKMRAAQRALHRKLYIFRSPDGALVRTENLKPFAEQYGLRLSNLSAIVHGTKKSHLGWTFIGFEDNAGGQHSNERNNI